MKKTFIALAALMPIVILAKPFGAMSEEEIKAADDSNWGNRISISGPAAEELTKLDDNLRTLLAKVKDCRDNFAAFKPDEHDRLKALEDTLSRPLVTDSIGLLPKPGDPPNVQRGYDRVNAYKVMLQALERKSRTKLRILVTDIIGFQMVERRAKWTSIHRRLDDKKYTEIFREIDAAYESFMHNMDILMLRNVTDVTGSEMLTVSKLGKFTDADCRTQSGLDNKLRTLDRYLAVMHTEALKVFEKYTAKTKEDSAAALSALAEDHDFYEQYALKLAPGDRKAVESLFKECSQFLDQVDKLLVKEAEKLLAAAKDTSTEVGMLRANTGFSKYKAFLAAGPTQPNGCPGYVRRVRVLLEDCKKRYMKHLDAMRRRYHDAPDRHIPKGWQ